VSRFEVISFVINTPVNNMQPSWSTRNDFRQYVKFPAEDVSGSEETDEAERTKTSRVQFSYISPRSFAASTD
jgi:hypothetical protein